MHLKRWLSGLIMAPALILFILYAPPWLFLLLILLLTFFSLGEFYSLALPGISPGQKISMLLLGALIPLSLYTAEPRCFIAALGFILLALFIWALFQPEGFPVLVEKVSKHLLGILYLSFFLAHLLLLRQMEGGKVWVLFTLVATYFGDTVAFYIGRGWGRKKLAPKISPGKTVEGGVGAAGGSVIGSLLFKVFFFPQLPLLHALVLGLGVGAIGQLGDLWESLLKRGAGVKDSGTLIPGHGGLLDRIDSLLFAGPFVYYYVWGTGLG
jgi:phosphatidate cytidylyltransferase